MASPQRRPRDKGGTELKNLAAKGFESSNSTMTKFLGGTQKSWMTGHHVFKDKPLSTSNNHSRSTPLQQNNPNQKENNPVGNQTRTSRNQSQADQQSIVMHNPRSATISSTMIAANTVDAPSTLTNQKQLLPSPAPSDEHRQEHRQESVHVIDLEQEEDQQNHVYQQQNYAYQQQISPGNEPSAIRLNDQAERQKSIEGFERRVQDTESHMDIPGLIDRNMTSSVHAEASRSAAAKRNLELESDSRKRAQFVGRPASEFNQLGHGLNHVEERPSAGPTAQVLSNTDIQSFLSLITDRLNSVNIAQERRGREIEIPRLGLLQDACNCRDYFYLIIHQLFCLKSTLAISNQSSSNGLTSEHSSGLTLLTHLLLPNDQMENQAVLWFSTFPLPLEILLENSPGLKPSYEKALRCLSKLPQNWMPVKDHCHRRCYPPLVDEMNSILGVASTVLQRVISRAILRDIWQAPYDECYSDGERLFRRNQQAVQSRESQESAGQTLNTAIVKAYNVQIAKEYQQIWSRHQEHVRPPSRQSNGPQQPQSMTSNISTSMAPPQQIQNNMLSATSVSFSQMPSPSTYAPSNPVSFFATSNSRSNPQSPIGFVNTPTLPSSPFSSTQISACTSTESSIPHYLAPSYIQLSAPPQQRRPRGRPRRDQAPMMASSATDLGGLVPDQSSAGNSYRQVISQPHSATNNMPPQSMMSPWGDQSAVGLGYAHFRQPTQPLTGMPATPPYRNNARVHLSHQSMSQQRSATFPLQRQGQVQSPSISSNPQSPVGPYNLPPGFYQPQSQRATGRLAQPSPSHLFLPPLGQTRSYTEPPNPISAALHQAQARSPTLTSIDTSGKSGSTVILFAFVRRLNVMPSRLNAEKRHFNWTVEIPKEEYDFLAKDIETNDGAPPRRVVQNGSCFSRVRCVNVTNRGEITEGDWVIAETTWPNGVAIIINGTALEIRKKIHHGKDLPVDVTKLIKEGTNSVKVATTRPKNDDQVAYAIGLETVQIADSTTIENAIPKLELKDALNRILEHSGGIDPDVQVINTATILDLTDPYTSRIFDKPVRGQTCRHNQCFDLEVFFQTRHRKNQSHPSLPDHFKCPICGSDARPQSLIMDLFFVSVRKDLEVMNRLDVKAIVLDEHGAWKIKEEEQAGESREDSNKLPSPVDGITHAQHRKVPERRESEIIELGDD